MQVADLFDPPRLRRRLEQSLAAKNVLLEHLYGRSALAVDDLLAGLQGDAEAIQPFVCDTTALLHDALSAGKRIVLEGQLGGLRDPDHGIYPYPTSSSPLAGFASVGAGLPPHAIGRIVAVAKAYSTCIGAGPFVTELAGAEGDDLRDRGGDRGEYGATTGRPRRVGWFDVVATRYGCQVQGATEVALTLLERSWATSTRSRSAPPTRSMAAAPSGSPYPPTWTAPNPSTSPSPAGAATSATSVVSPTCPPTPSATSKRSRSGWRCRSAISRSGRRGRR